MNESRAAELPLLVKAALQSGENTWQTRRVDKAKLRPILLSDGPHGVRKQAGDGDHLGINASLPATCFPTAATVANSWDLDLARRIGEALGEEARSLGVDVILGPGLNIKRNPLGGRNFEYFSEDPYLSGKLAASYVRGIQSQGVASCPKHFAANSQETNRMTSNSVVDDQTLRQIYLTAFEIVVKEAHPIFMMTSYNLLNGVYANENEALLQGILRKEWGFDGAVVTDWGGGDDPVLAVKVGGGFEMPSPGFATVPPILEAVSKGKLSERELDMRVDELARAIDQIRVTEGECEFDTEAHNLLAREAASEGAVLLRNEGSILPLAPKTKVALIGDFAKTPRYQGAGSSLVNPTHLVTALQAIEDTELNLVGYASGFRRDRTASAELIEEALKVTAEADVTLLYLGLDELSETEGADRSHLDLPENQVRLLQALSDAGRKVVVVLSAGSVTSMPWLNQCQALLHGYLCGQAGAAAIFDLLCGVANPSGRLAETYPVSLGDLPSSGRFPAPHKNAEYKEGLFVGYRYTETAEVPVLFPFGFGLSYSEIRYCERSVTGNGVQVTLSNESDRDAVETVQLYVGRSKESPTGVIRPVRQLAGFVRVEVPARSAVQVEVPFDGYSFRHYDSASKSWLVESGKYSLFLGPNVRDAEFAGDVIVGDGAAEAQVVRVAATVLGDYELVEPDLDRLEGLPHYASGQVSAVCEDEWNRLLDNPRAILPEPTGPLTLNSALSEMARADSFLARFLWRRMEAMLKKSEAKGVPDLNLLFLSAMPFRSIYNMSGGMASEEMVEAMLKIVNGHFFSGTGGLISGFFRNRQMQKRLRKSFDVQAGNLSQEQTH